MSDDEFISPEDFARAERGLSERMNAELLKELTGGKIKPALSEDGWRRKTVGDGDVVIVAKGRSLVVDVYRHEAGQTLRGSVGAGDLKGLIALANDTLDDSDPRKIDAGKIHMMRVIGEAMQELAKQSGDVGVGIERIMAGGYLKDFATALESYLPAPTVTPG